MYEFRFRIAGVLLCLSLLGLPAGGAASESGATPVDAESTLGLLAQDRWREALDAARGMHDAEPDDPRSAELLGRALYRAGEFEEVDRLLAPLVEKDDASPWTLMTLARLRNAEGRHRESATLMNRALEGDPRDPVLLYWAADIAPRREQRVALLERYLEIGKDDDPDRVEDARGTLNVMEQLGGRDVWVSIDRPERLELPLRHVWDDLGQTVGYVVEARVGEKNKRARLLVDTGNPGLYLTSRVARKGGFASLGEATTYGGGGGGRQRVGRGVFPVFAVGELRYGEALATATAEELDTTGRFHGLLGLTPFMGYRVTLDLKQKRLQLDRSEERSEGSPYWVVSGQILVRAGIDGGPEGLFMFDTGATRTLLSTGYVERVPDARAGADADVKGVGGSYGGAQRVPGVRMRFQDIVGKEGLAAVDLSVRSRMTGVEVSGYLGLELLDKTRIVIDTRSRTIRVSH